MDVTWCSQVKKTNFFRFLLKEQKFKKNYFMESLGATMQKIRKIVFYIYLEKISQSFFFAF